MALVAATAVFAGGTFTYKRTYRIGNTYGYMLTTNTFHNGKLVSKSRAKSLFRVVRRDGIPSTRVKFLGLKMATPKSGGGFHSLDHFARKVKPFYLSLAPGGRLAVPNLTVPHMTGPVTDMVTYLVALSPKAGIGSLHLVGEHVTATTPFGCNWANGRTAFVGRDELSVTSRLVALAPKTATMVVAFTPPPTTALTMAHSWMVKPVAAPVPNNFEQVSPEGGAKVYAMWGHERFTIMATVARSTGMILHATMLNKLDVKLRVQCNRDFTRCGPEIPFSIIRKEELVLLPHA